MSFLSLMCAYDVTMNILTTAYVGSFQKVQILIRSIMIKSYKPWNSLVEAIIGRISLKFSEPIRIKLVVCFLKRVGKYRVAIYVKFIILIVTLIQNI